MKSPDLWSKRSVLVALALTSVFGAWAFWRVNAYFESAGLGAEWSNASLAFGLVSVLSGGAGAMLTWGKHGWLRKAVVLIAYQAIVAYLIVINLMVDVGPDQLNQGFSLWLASSFVWASGLVWSFLAFLAISFQFATRGDAAKWYLGGKGR